MTVQELLDVLNDCDPDAEVRLGVQPSYPLRHAVAGVASADLDEALDDVADGFVWILATDGHGEYDENPYAPSALWEGV
jgi:hypothetical protein